MKSRIFIAVLIVVLLVGGFFLPTKSGLRDEVEPESNPITVFQEVEEEQQAAEEAREEEERKQEESEIINSLPETEQEAYAWAALRSDPESLLMTPERISEYNAALIQNTSFIDILNVPSYTPDQIKDLLTEDQALVKDLTGMKDAITNQNLDSTFHDLRRGIVLSRSALKVLPTDEPIEGPDGEVVDVALLTSSTPVWILHNSKDSLYTYVQSAYGRGWIPTQNVASASSQEIWLSYVAPEYKVVITAAEVNAEGYVLDMGSVFACIEENGDAYTLLIPTRRSDGAVEGREITLDRTVSSLGYIDYTWVHLFKQLYLYKAQNIDVSTDGLIHNIYHVFGLELPGNLSEDLEALGTATDLSALSDEELTSAYSSIAGPALIQDADGVSLFLGPKEGEVWKFRQDNGKGQEVIVDAPEVLTVIG